MKALGILEDHRVKKMKITWRDCCVKACDDLISDHSGRTIELWYCTCMLNNKKIVVSQMGIHYATKDLNHFLEIKKDCDTAYRDNNDTCQEMMS